MHLRRRSPYEPSIHNCRAGGDVWPRARPGSITAGELAELCAQKGKDPAGAAKLNFCLGYAQGTFDSEEKHAAGKKLFCLTSPAPTRAATMAEFASWVRSSGSTGTPSQEALLQFMVQKYPCK